MMIVTTEQIPGRHIVKALGFVQGSSIRARHIGRDLLAAFKNITGGEITEYTKLMAEAREQALDRMREQAAALGGDAVVCVRFVTTEVMENAAELVAYGTAVVTEEAAE
ncbi:MAG: YbjQ family protein [Candidatus Krumholzibacteria bacterium]|nr:YbjQ family protein [Candidatus Krumholzibacteria bacterium]